MRDTMHRSIDRIIPAMETMEGDRVPIRRAFPTRSLMELDPFLLLDEMGPMEIQAGDSLGFPEHPHRGFETVTYLLEGAMEHRDSHGHQGRLGAGDVQWMTAGAGVVHSEMPGPDVVRHGGRLHGFQLWVNLPKRDKMMQPRYQEIPASRIPTIRNPEQNVVIRVIAGQALSQKGAIQTLIPITYLHLTIQPGAEYAQPVPQDQNAFAYVISGEADFGGSVPSGTLALFLRDGDSVWLANSPGARRPAEVLFVAAQPIGEPVARAGPFVMNTQEEIRQAFEDYRNGRF